MGSGHFALGAMLAALVLISAGTGLFKGNLQVMVGNLYDDPKFADKRDAAFSIFYMAINVGALFAPTAAVKIMSFVQTHYNVSVADSYHFAFGIACLSLIISIAIYYIFRSTFRQTENGSVTTADGKTASAEKELTPQETKSRIVALCLVFAVVIFFWMAFHQNGLTLTLFADQFTAKTATGVESMAFDVVNLLLLIFRRTGIQILSAAARHQYRRAHLPAVQPLLRRGSDAGEHRHLRRSRQEGQGAQRSAQDSSGYARSRLRLRYHDHRQPVPAFARQPEGHG